MRQFGPYSVTINRKTETITLRKGDEALCYGPKAAAFVAGSSMTHTQAKQALEWGVTALADEK